MPRYDAAGDRLLRTTAIPNYDLTWTWMAWVYAVALPAVGSYANLFSFNDDNLYEDSLEFKGTTGSNKRLVAGTSNGSYEETVGTTAIATSTWYHMAFVRTSTTQLLAYINGVLEITETHSARTRVNDLHPATRLECGDWGSGNTAPFSGRQQYMKMWNGAALSVTEILQEMNVARPVTNLANLFGFWPCFPGSGERARDYSGTGHDWTETGTLTDEDPPPVSYGAPVLAMPHHPVSAPPYQQRWRYANRRRVA